MVRRLVLLFLLANIVGVVANAPRIIASLDGGALSSTLTTWVVGVSSAVGDLLDEATATPLTDADVLRIEQELRDGALEDPLDDQSVAALVELWRALRTAGEQVRADELAELLLEQDVDVERQPAAEPVPLPTLVP